VVRYKPRKQRTLEDHDVPFFRKPGCEDGFLRIPEVNHGRGMISPTHVHPKSMMLLKEPIIRGKIVEYIDANTRISYSDPIYNDIDYEDEVNVAYDEV
jgi:hypothetical protein